MLYYPWYDEQREVLGGYDNYDQHYQHVQAIVPTNEQQYCHDGVHIVDSIQDEPVESQQKDLDKATKWKSCWKLQPSSSHQQTFDLSNDIDAQPTPVPLAEVHTMPEYSEATVIVKVMNLLN